MLNRLRAIHGQAAELKVPLAGRKKSIKNEKHHFPVMDEPIDFVVTWVDGNDPEWLKEKQKYASAAGREGNITARFREWDIFVYWFRMVEKYAPWVHKVYLVTWGHVPSWLNKECSKLVVVKHEDFIPAEYLPTFSSVSIELNLWRIKDLCEHFVYFNDDMFLTKPVNPTDFFDRGLPKYEAITQPLECYGDYAFFQHELFSNLGLINKHFNIKECMDRNPEKWFSHVLGEDLKYNILTYQSGYLSGMHFTHLACPYRKSTFEKVWNECYERLDWTCMHKFREPLDIMHQIFQLWDMFEGNFVPVSRGYYGRARINISETSINQAVSEENIFVCLNDNETITESEFYNLQNYCINTLGQKYSTKSSFEK